MTKLGVGTALLDSWDLRPSPGGQWPGCVFAQPLKGSLCPMVCTYRPQGHLRPGSRWRLWGCRGEGSKGAWGLTAPFGSPKCRWMEAATQRFLPYSQQGTGPGRGDG